MSNFLLPLPTETCCYIEKIIKQDNFFKISEFLNNDGICERHVLIANYLKTNGRGGGPNNFYRSLIGDGIDDVNTHLSTSSFLSDNLTYLHFKQDFGGEGAFVSGHTFCLKNLRNLCFSCESY